jgi:hypothetical protein
VTIVEVLRELEVYGIYFGNWVTGRKADGTEKKFKNLEQAFTYGEMLHFRPEYADRVSRLSLTT